MDLTVGIIINAILAIVAVLAEIRARNSEKNSAASADAAQRSALAAEQSLKVAEEALNFSKEQASKRHLETAIEAAAALSKERGRWQKGLQFFINTNPDLVQKKDFPTLCKPFFIRSGLSTDNLRTPFEELIKAGYLTEIPNHWDFSA